MNDPLALAANVYYEPILDKVLIRVLDGENSISYAKTEESDLGEVTRVTFDVWEAGWGQPIGQVYSDGAVWSNTVDDWECEELEEAVAYMAAKRSAVA